MEWVVGCRRCDATIVAGLEMKYIVSSNDVDIQQDQRWWNPPYESGRKFRIAGGRILALQPSPSLELLFPVE